MATSAKHRQFLKSEELPYTNLPSTSYSSPSSSSSSSNSNNKKWSNFLAILVGLVVIGEIAFLGRLDMAKNSDLFNSWADSFKHFTQTTTPSWSTEYAESGQDRGSEADDSCQSWLEKEDSVPSSRDFKKDPILVDGPDEIFVDLFNCIFLEKRKDIRFINVESVDISQFMWLPKSVEESLNCDNNANGYKAFEREIMKGFFDFMLIKEEWKTCAVGCKFGSESGKKPDAAFGILQPPGTASVLRSMESAKYYADNNIDTARRRGYDVVMTTSLSSDVPVGYFSWAEYDIMAPVQPKTEQALAAAFISNCGSQNFRLQALVALENANIKIDSYGGCHRNRDGRVDKVETLKRYKFSLAFENSIEEDYVTEKFFQSLVAGSVPVVIGAPNIEDFAPSPGSLLHIGELKDVDFVAKKLKYLAENISAYNESLRWKFEGPSDSFKALVDMAAVHSSCRLCIHLATKIQDNDEKTPEFQKRPCKCTRGLNTLYHIYVRERGRFEMESIFLRSDNLTLEALSSAVLMKFKSLKHMPIWKPDRPESLRGGDKLKVYKIYPVGMTQRQALYAFSFKGDSHFKNHIESHPCAKFEVVFV